MKVKLINHTPAPDETVYKAARVCYQAGTIEDIKAPTKDGMEKFIQRLIKSGHTSTLEHATFTFAIEGVSRVVSHEIVRHRMASYSQQSQRYVNYQQDNGDFVDSMYVPDDIANDIDRYAEYRKALMYSAIKYKELISMGVKPQDARYVLPGAMNTQIVCTFNARSLLNFFSLRCCRRAQPEMQELAFAMLNEVKKVAPIIFSKAGRQCASCIESRKPAECK